MMIDLKQTTLPPAQGMRLKFGVALFGLSIAVPLIGVPLVSVSGLDSGTAVTISGVMLVAAEVLGVFSVALMGKGGYIYIKSRVFGFLKKYGPPAEVSRPRYLTGLFLFILPIVFGLVEPYLARLIPGYLGNEITFAIAGDVMLIVSLFVLGGDFWDKLRALLSHRAKAVYLAPDD